jgi:CheY-like chemotaxis protein
VEVELLVLHGPGVPAELVLEVVERDPRRVLARAEVERLVGLVVEDDALDYKMIVRMLGEDFEVTRAHQLTDAELRLSEDPFHMVLLDLSLPDGHGLELIKRMRSLLERPVPVVVVTGHGEGITSDSLAAGLVSGWVSKAQLTKEALQATIERALAA